MVVRTQSTELFVKNEAEGVQAILFIAPDFSSIWDKEYFRSEYEIVP